MTHSPRTPPTMLSPSSSTFSSDRYVRSGLWLVRGDFQRGSKLGGKKVGIVGLGKIGFEVAKRLTAFGCRIAYNSRKEKPSVTFPFYASVCDLTYESDVLVVCCSLTAETHHIINRDVMKALGKEGVIIKVGRGALVDEQELVRFLTQGEIGGAGLDLFESEPCVPRELFDLDNVVLSPHTAVLTTESNESLDQIVLANLKAFFSIIKSQRLRYGIQEHCSLSKCFCSGLILVALFILRCLGCLGEKLKLIV